MRADLFTHPKVVRISSALEVDTLRTVGGLMSVWCLFDAHSIDGRLEGYSLDYLDSHLRWDGFAEAMQSVDWLFDYGMGLELPGFDTHNGESAKRRAQDADRKRKVRNMSADEADKKRTREEKRRDSNTTTTARPTIDDVSAYVETRSIKIDPTKFIDYYTANGWKVGRNSMKDWKAAVRTWERSENANTKNPIKQLTDSRRLSGAERTRLAREQAFARQRDAAGASDLGCVESN
jgi:hypothetical protein